MLDIIFASILYFPCSGVQWGPRGPLLCRVKGVGLGLEHRQQRELVARVYPGEHFKGQGRDLGVSTLPSTDH